MYVSRIFGEEIIDPAAIKQFKEALNTPSVVSGALMPDAHLGYGIPIGGVVATKGTVVPSWVGFDIGCGVLSRKIPFTVEEILKNQDGIFEKINETIPLGKNAHKNPQEFSSLSYIWDCLSDSAKEIYKGRALYQLCTLGGGNHFIEIGNDSNNKVYITVHSGSRNFGHSIATHYMKIASCSDKAKEGSFPLDASSIEGKNYLSDAIFCNMYSFENRNQIFYKTVECIQEVLGFKKPRKLPTNKINKSHNFVTQVKTAEGVYYIHRKGACEAGIDSRIAIPGSMQDGVYIVKGLGNEDSLVSCSHGAGRVLSRSRAKRELKLEAFEKAMSGIKAKVDNTTLDESPFAYKNIDTVLDYQKDSIKIVKKITPIINIKG